jgi:predicted helicase
VPKALNNATGSKDSGKQKIVVELYNNFFRNAFPAKMTERLGIVYTPVEVVDFIIHSVNHILQTEFGQTLGSKGVHISTLSPAPAPSSRACCKVG